MTTKARIEDGIVREILTADPFPLFHPSLVWVECGSEVREGWTWDGSVFREPPGPPEPDQTAIALEETLAQVRELESRQARAIREAVLTGDRTRLVEIEAKIAALMGRAPVTAT